MLIGSAKRIQRITAWLDRHNHNHNHINLFKNKKIVLEIGITRLALFGAILIKEKRKLRVQFNLRTSYKP